MSLRVCYRRGKKFQKFPMMLRAARGEQRPYKHVHLPSSLLSKTEIIEIYRFITCFVLERNMTFRPKGRTMVKDVFEIRILMRIFYKIV